jgi:cell division transport system permease protein
MLDRLSFLLGEAIQGLKRRGLMTFAAISTVAVALFLISGMAYLYLTVSRYADGLSSRFEIQAYFKDGTNFQQIKSTAEELRKNENVRSVVWIPRDKAWEKEQKLHPDLTRGIENPYPDALKITVKDVKKVDGIIGQLKSTSTIDPEAVMYHDQTQRFLAETLPLIQGLGVLLGGLLFATGGILIYNVTRVTADARKREIRVMQLVGASYATIRLPFIIEGLIQGLLGGALATALLWATYTGVANHITRNLTAFDRPEPFATTLVAFLLCILGSAYGVGCSMIAIHGPSRLRGRAI